MKRPQDLAGLRAAMGPVLAERQTLQAEARDQPQAQAEIGAYCTSAAAEIQGRLTYIMSSGEGLPDALAVRARADGRIDLAPLLVALFGEATIAAALAKFANDLPASIDRAARAARLAEIAAELDALEDAEEVEVCRLEGLGLSPGRRGDARPSIVLRKRG